MKEHVMLVITSLLMILLFTFHWADEISRGMEPGDLSAFGGIVILSVWLCGTLLLNERRWGQGIMLLGSILASGVLLLHMSGRGLVGGRIANTSGQFFWVTNLIALGVLGNLSVILSVRALWRSWRRPQ